MVLQNVMLHPVILWLIVMADTLKHVVEIIAPPFAKLIKGSFGVGKFPQSLKSAIAAPNNLTESGQKDGELIWGKVNANDAAYFGHLLTPWTCVADGAGERDLTPLSHHCLNHYVVFKERKVGPDPVPPEGTLWAPWPLFFLTSLPNVVILSLKTL